jgi:hypothetical protein
MNNEIFEFLSSRSGDTETAENSRIKEIALELSRRCSLYEEKYANSSHHVKTSVEQTLLFANTLKKITMLHPLVM